jgi:hypothetical protein
MNKEGKDMEKGQDLWGRHLKAVEIARTVLREETALWRESFDLTEDEYSASQLAMEMQLFAMSLRAPLSAGGIDTVEFFCELTGVDFSSIMEIMNSAISYGVAVVNDAENNNGQ